MQRLLLIFPFLILFSCSVQKRKYQKGFYVSHTSQKKRVQKNDAIVIKSVIENEELVLKPATLPLQENERMILSVSAYKNILLSLPIKELPNPDSLCDVLTLKNGDDVLAKILEITPTLIKYQKCNVTDGPLYIAKKSNVFRIKYANGTSEVFKSDEPATVATDPNSSSNTNTGTGTKTYNGPKTIQPFAVIAFILAILGFVTLGLGSILAILLANLALKRIRQEPNRYSGSLLARVAKILASTMLSIVLTAILLSLLFGR